VPRENDKALHRFTTVDTSAEAKPAPKRYTCRSPLHCTSLQSSANLTAGHLPTAGGQGSVLGNRSSASPAVLSIPTRHDDRVIDSGDAFLLRSLSAKRADGRSEDNPQNTLREAYFSGSEMIRRVCPQPAKGAHVSREVNPSRTAYLVNSATLCMSSFSMI